MLPSVQSEDAFNNMERDPMDADCIPRSLQQLLADTWFTRKRGQP